MIFNRIQRWWQRRGFGIESKTDYAFLHDVLREKLPYYAYSEWPLAYPHATQEELQQAQLLFRISNRLQPATTNIHGDAQELTVKAVQQGCLKTKVMQHATPYIKLDSAAITAKLEHGFIIEYCQGREATEGMTALVLTDIDSYNAALWQNILHTHAITYDMRHLGIALLCKGRYPEHYKI